MKVNKSKARLFISSLVGLALLALLVGTIFAAYISIPFAGSTAVSLKYHTHYAPNSWYANIESSMDWGAGPAIDTIGWTSWRYSEKCNGAVVDDDDIYPVAAHNVKFQGRTSAQYIGSCAGSRQTITNGYHQFEEGGSSTYPWVQEIRNYP